MKTKNRNYLEPTAERLWEGFMADDTFNDSTEYNIQKIYDLESQLKEVDKVILELYDEGRIHRKVYLKLNDQIEKYKQL